MLFADRLSCTVLAAALSVLTATEAAAQWITLRGDTLLSAGSGRPAFGASDSRAQVPLYELMQARVEDLGVAGLGLELSGFVGGHLSSPPLEGPRQEATRFAGELTVGLLRWQDLKRGIVLTVGRQYLFAGAGRAEHLDGLSFQVRGPWNLDLLVFGGRTTPWQVDYEPEGGDPGATSEVWYLSNYAAGGRARFRMLERAVAAVGFVHEGHGSETVRQSLSVDAGYWSSRYLEAVAGTVLDTVALLPEQVWVGLTSRPARGLKLSLDYSYQVPSLSIPKTSIFSVFTLDSYQEIAGGVHLGIGERLSLGVEGGARLFPGEAELRVGWDAAASARLALSEVGGRATGLRLEVLEADGERLLRGRLYLTYAFAVPLYLSGEGDFAYLTTDRSGTAASIFERRIDAQAISAGGLALLGYRFPHHLSLQVAGSAFTTPAARYDLRLLARFSYEPVWGRAP